jgi:hypothetical protein
MREVNVVVRCDRCLDKMDTAADKPMDKWIVLGTSYRTELCPNCQTEVMDFLSWLTPATQGGPGGVRKGKGKYAEEISPCTEPGCERVFTTKAGLAQHRSQKHGGKGRWGRVQQPRTETDRPGDGPSAYPCEFCGKTLPTKSGRSGHERASHPAEWLSRKEAQ